MRAGQVFLVLFFASIAYPQMPATGSFYYSLTPREAKVGQTVTFEVFEFNMCLYFYDVTYELQPTPISSKRTMIVNMVAKRKPSCATAAGYSGPKVFFENLDVGAYVLKFDSTSDFKKDLGDTNKFEITPPSMSASKKKFGGKSANHWKKLGNRRIDGKEVRTKRGRITRGST
jgi:hypothetical protein